VVKKFDIRAARPVNAKIFARFVYARVSRRSPGWKERDVNEWLRGMLPRFGHPDCGWTIGDAIALGDDFLSEASTW
jgi:hypothetical protein